jgi:TM2 domain-containing membrane protein YozV
MNKIRHQRKERTAMRSPGTAAVLSFFLPGVGQIYNGRFLWAIFWFIITPGLWIGSGGFLGWICHFLSAFQAHSQAKRR